MVKQLYAQRIGRHSRAEVLQLGNKLLDLLVTVLKYFLEDKPSSVNATAFAFLANIIWRPLSDPLKPHALQLATIEADCNNRIWEAYYSDLLHSKVKK